MGSLHDGEAGRGLRVNEENARAGDNGRLDLDNGVGLERSVVAGDPDFCA